MGGSVYERFVPWLEAASLDLVQRITGHRTAAVVLKHYFRPGREDFRTVITQAMPKMLGLGESKLTAKEEMKRILERSTNRTWSADRKRLLELIESL